MKIELSGIELRGRHGVLEHERREGQRFLFDVELDVGEAGEPAVVEGVPGQWRVDPAQLGQPFTGRAALLSPFDRLVADRKRLDELFEFDYILEMYKPAAARIWGYYALPILYGDRMVGKLDAKAEGAVVYAVRDFYLTNAITRSSPTMHTCSEELVHGRAVQEAAE